MPHFLKCYINGTKIIYLFLSGYFFRGRYYGGGGVTFRFNSKVNSREEGSWMIKITFQGVNFEHSMKIIATY